MNRLRIGSAHWRHCSLRALCLCFALSLVGPPSAFPQVPVRLSGSTTLPKEWFIACEMERDPLETSTVARNPEVYPSLVARVPGGWLVYDMYEAQVLELDEGLNEIRRWGRSGPGPREYQDPVGLGKAGTGEVVIIDQEPPSLMVLGGSEDNEYRLTGVPLWQGVAAVDTNRALIGLHDGSIHEVRFDNLHEGLGLWELSDFGFAVEEGVGMLPRYLFRFGPAGSLHAGFVVSSRIWTLDGPQPAQTLQRCVPDVLKDMPEVALHTKPAVSVAGATTAPLSIPTLADYVPLAGGRTLALGSRGILDRDGNGIGKSIELYDSAGRRIGAWQLPLAGGGTGMFDPDNPRRILVWNQGEDPGIELIEVNGRGYPGGP